MAKTVVSALLLAFDEAYDKHSWHGTNLRGSLRGIDHITAAARPAPDRHNIWELALHAAYWKYTVVRRLTGAAQVQTELLEGRNHFLPWNSRPAVERALNAALACAPC